MLAMAGPWLPTVEETVTSSGFIAAFAVPGKKRPFEEMLYACNDTAESLSQKLQRQNTDELPDSTFIAACASSGRKRSREDFEKDARNAGAARKSKRRLQRLGCLSSAARLPVSLAGVGGGEAAGLQRQLRQGSLQEQAKCDWPALNNQVTGHCRVEPQGEDEDEVQLALRGGINVCLS